MHVTLQRDGVSRWRPRPGTSPTQRDLECFAATLRLDVETRWEALLALGWLRIPPQYDLAGAGGASQDAARAGPLGVDVRRSPGSPGAVP